MKGFIFSMLLILLPLSALAREADSIYVKDSIPGKYDHRIHRYRKYWESLIPTQIIIQNAGNMGYISGGFGWEYGRRGQWETHLLWGFLPKYSSTRAKLTMTVKETYIPWSINLGKGFALEPLSSGIYVNTVYGHEFWKSQPGRYPDKYYQALSTKFRLNVFLGQRVTFNIPERHRFLVKAVTAFYEVSTCDLYIRAMIQDDQISLWQILGLSLGLKFQLL
ncbi:MAG: hypothetical protein PUF37_03995 [Prevotellaceae bacterium]|nr:hypothetical protein [Prevotella sp.]MDD6552733.1 hypothetical protein [Prevotellaceae bacterium]